MELLGYVMNYEWGKTGFDSVVAQLASLNDKDFAIDGKKTYAELWMGDHVSGPAKVKNSGQEISQVIDTKLPFLLKVLSINKALSIQVHPNKEEAERLHRERPDIYKDPNHKPELAIALTPFVALCGFRPYQEIFDICNKICPLGDLVGSEKLTLLREEKPESIKQVFQAINYASQEQVITCLKLINDHYKSELEKFGILKVFENLNREFPNDIGILSLFFLNLIRLKPGQSIYLGANIIHAYLSGDCIECMACSDNVIRAGLTPKYRDVEQLLASLNYTAGSVEDNIFKPLQVDEHQQIYAPPIEDFAVRRLTIPSTLDEDYCLEYKPTDSILIVIKGSAKLELPSLDKSVVLKKGSIFFIPSNAAPLIKFKTISEGMTDIKEDFEVYIASANIYQDMLK